jgi:hypothetical protein
MDLSRDRLILELELKQAMSTSAHVFPCITVLDANMVFFFVTKSSLGLLCCIEFGNAIQTSD